MVVGTVLQGRRYTFGEYLAASLLILGISLFTLGAFGRLFCFSCCTAAPAWFPPPGACSRCPRPAISSSARHHHQMKIVKRLLNSHSVHTRAPPRGRRGEPEVPPGGRRPHPPRALRGRRHEQLRGEALLPARGSPGRNRTPRPRRLVSSAAAAGGSPAGVAGPEDPTPGAAPPRLKHTHPACPAAPPAGAALHPPSPPAGSPPRRLRPRWSSTPPPSRRRTAPRRCSSPGRSSTRSTTP